MHYIRFLKPPRIYVDRGTVLLKTVVTVTTDLGETFYSDDLELIASLRDTDEDGDIYLRRKIQWQAGLRALSVSFDLSHQDVDWPACLHVTAKNPVKSSGFLSPFIDVWSGLLHPTRGHMDSGHLVERRFLSSAERTVSLLEETGDSIARHLWDGSQALAEHIDQIISCRTSIASPLALLEYVLISATYRKLTVLELGCGCGTVGISLAQSIPDCDVLLTDLPEVGELVQANIARMKPAIASKVTFSQLDWEQDLPAELRARVNDLIIVSECTYNTDTLQPLVATLAALTVRSPKAAIVVSTKTRHDSESSFFEMMKKAGLVADGSMRAPLPGSPGTGYADGAIDVGIHVFHGRNHRLSLSPRDSGNKVPLSSRSRSKRRRSP